MKRLATLTLCAVAVAAGTSTMPASAKNPLRRYIVISRSAGSVPGTVFTQIQQANGQVRKNLATMGLVAVSSDDPGFATKISDALAVVPDLRIESPRPRVQTGPPLAEVAAQPGPPDTQDDDFFLDLEWGITAIDAQNGWQKGHRGQGALIAILDEGVDATHPDLADNVRADLSTSFAEDCSGQIEDWQPEPGFYFNHGTHVAGTAAAADNAFGVVGVAPRAQIMAVDVLSRCLGYGADSWVLDGIKYAADHGADVINMSLGGILNVNGGCSGGECYTAEDVANLTIAYTYAAQYARAQGAILIASAGNESVNFDAEPDLIHLPSDAPGILSISAIAPLGWGANPQTNLLAKTYYSNFGEGRIDFAAPGGTDEYFLTDPSGVCTVAGVSQLCFVMDFVFSTIPGGWAWAAGTSMSAAHVSGIAAQYIGAAGGSLTPAAVESQLRAYAARPKAVKQDTAFYGRGVADATPSANK